MRGKQTGAEPAPGMSKVKLALGAASLFLFIVGLKRTFRIEDAHGGLTLADLPAAVPEASSDLPATVATPE